MKSLKVLSLVIVLIIGMSFQANKNDKLFEITKNIEIFANVFQQLNTKFVDEIDPSELMRIGLDAMVGSLDPYTNFISESQIESYRLTNEGKYQGIGAAMDKIGDFITVIEPVENGPAVQAGLKAGDQIVEVNGFKTKGKTNDEVSAISKGIPGTTMNLKIKRPGESGTKDIELTRGAVEQNNVPYYGMVADNIGYITLTVFTENAGANITKALKKLKKDNELDGIILDLRSNGGGLLREAITISNIFIPKDMEVVTTKGKVKDRDRTYNTMTPPVDTEIPIVVLTNKKSASASEIVSGVIQDYDRGVIMGQRTFGKGLVQNTEEVGYNSRVKLTTSKYYIPSRRCIQAVEYDNGEPVDIPDNQRSKFKTKNGRVVLDGGGVTPDVKLEPKENSEYTQALLKDYVIFSFVNEWTIGKDSIAEPRDFVFDDFGEFKTYVNNSEFDFVSKTEEGLQQLKEEGSKEMVSEFEALISKIQLQESGLLDQNKDELIREIEMEIISRYYFQSGKAKHRLNGDSEVLEAINLLNDKSRYNSILKI